MKTRRGRRAGRILESLRSGCDGDERLFDFLLREFREEIEKNSLSFAELNTSEEELKKLLVKNRKLSAYKWLNVLRRPPCLIIALGEIRRLTKESGFQLADIGSSEEELQRKEKILGPG